MTKRFLLMTLILVISTALIACGKKYDKEIEEVTSLEAKDRNDSSDPEFNKYERKKSNIYVYEDGKVITLTYAPFKGSSELSTRMYIKNETTGNYKEDINGKPKKFMKENKPDFKEENLKE
ncbi:cystatin-like fold lipoprotein [Staphylococcus aureus]|uniref:cystatin-like fold lipoprotein n=1 Tax=Staphylococcus aureus TaxID=1280 RepID=UPI000E02F276|nr:cystatin-like fold lipoprotein [Staphylococcus aureus]MBH4735897.1 cystatin-like fold lipoprotein [Staphylococcus aureus]MBH4738655.1 cystatin-like fold lipoprotein [Staphylococcus aureus]MBH4741499.1 cystatin-like fold lipoprotein [Staphylococcus aureus]MBH4743338.1 cystatin-like fold lipoprotein [Staphylococcus aureus]MBH4747559.1 cystatin-like fold lipoprotein [Staphylococcus aureus]